MDIFKDEQFEFLDKKTRKKLPTDADVQIGKEYYLWRDSSSKKQGKKSVAYSMLCDVLEWGD